VQVVFVVSNHVIDNLLPKLPICPLLLTIWKQCPSPWMFQTNWKLELRHHECHDPSFRFTTKTKAWKSVGQECNPRVTFTFLGVWESVREYVHTLPNGLPLRELETLRNFEFTENNFKGQNSLDWRVFYNIGKILRRKCLKWACTQVLITQVMIERRVESQSANLIPNH
jgi:hypothetical protein